MNKTRFFLSLFCILTGLAFRPAHAALQDCNSLDPNNLNLSLIDPLRLYLLSYDTYAALENDNPKLEVYQTISQNCEDFLKKFLMAEAERAPKDYVSNLNHLNQLALKTPQSAMALGDLAFLLQSEWEGTYLAEFYEKLNAREKRSALVLNFSFFTSTVFGLSHGFLPHGVGPFGSFRRAFIFSDSLDYLSGDPLDLFSKHFLKIDSHPVPPPPSSILSFAVPKEMDLLNQAATIRKKDEMISQAAGVLALNTIPALYSEVNEAFKLPPVVRGLAWIGTIVAAIYAQKFATNETRSVLNRYHLRATDADLFKVVSEYVAATQPHAHVMAVSELMQDALIRVALRDSEMIAAERSNLPSHGILPDEEFPVALRQALAAKGYKLDPVVARDFMRRRLKLLLPKISESEFSKTNLENLTQGWDPRLRDAEREWASTLGQGKNGKFDMQTVLASLDEQEKRDIHQLSSEMKAGKFRKNSDAFLLQVQDLLKETDWDFDQKYWGTSVLGSLISRYCVFTDAFTESMP